MTPEDKLNIDLDIVNLMSKITLNPEEGKDAALYIRGDSEFQTASINIKGDARIMAQTIQGLLDNNPAFKQFMFSTIISWLSQNPNQQKEFLAGVDLMKEKLNFN